MKQSWLYLVFFFLTLSTSSFGQFDKQQFLSDFQKADRKGRVKLAANVDPKNMPEVFPFIKDTLDVIRRKVFTNSSSKEAKFLFDKIDVSHYISQSQFAKAAILLESSLSAHVRNLEDSIYCYQHLRECFMNLNNLSKVIETNTIYDRLALHSKDKRYINNIHKKSKIYDFFGLNKQALNELYKELNYEMPARKNDTDFIANFHNNVGVFYNRLKNSDSAIVHFSAADVLITKKLAYSPNKKHYQFFKGLIEGNMALAYANKGEDKKAIPFLKADVYYSKMVNDHESQFNSCIVLSRCYMNLKQPVLSWAYADSAQEIINNFSKPRMRLKLFYLQAELLDAQANPLAVKKLKAYLNLKDSISNVEKELQLINQQVALDIQKKDDELNTKNEMIKTAEVNEGKQKVFRAYLMAGLIITIILVGFLVYTNNNSKQREEELAMKNQQIQFQNKQIEASLKEKEMLLREIHHRVKNNLQIINSVINLQSDKTQDEEMNEVFAELKGRISSIALTHQMLYQKGTANSVVLCEYMQNLISQIYKSYENENIKVNYSCNNQEFVINIDTAIPLGLLVNEIMTNSFKHAFKKTGSGRINIINEISGNQVKLTIKDDGSGLPQNFEEILEKPSSLGFELIAILVQQIDATMKMENDGGACFKISFKA